ncbi:MAG: LysR substrate-binding domain-containing protein [Hydrogenimonas sp.]|nr:LysR substrate-binding domain-containing protein [Hydrogenimonas sp.]
MSQENKGELTVGASTTIADYIMPHIICEYMDKYPDVKISMKIGNTDEIVKMVEEGSVDLGYIEGEIQNFNVVTSPVGVDELVIVTGDKNLVKKKEYYIDNLLEYKWILREEGSGTREVFLTHLGDLASQVNLFLELSHPESIKNMLIQSKSCFSCLPRVSVMKELERGELFEVKIKKMKFERHFLLIYHKDKYKTSLLNKFIYFIRMQLGKLLKR